MHTNDRCKRIITDILLPIWDKLPDEQYVDVIGSTTRAILAFQARTQKDVKNIRQVFPGQMWTKEYNQNLSWWEYKTHLTPKFTIRIYAVFEGPQQCKAIEETYTVVESVPTAWREETVMKTRTRWECPDSAEE